jgi:gluconokinase
LTFFDFFDADEGRPPRFPDDPPPPGEPLRGAARIPGLRSPWGKVGGIMRFGRMLDKIRSFHQGKLPPAWVEAKGSVTGFDGVCCRLLQVDYEALEKETLKGGGDDQMLQWGIAHGRKPSAEEIEIWNDYIAAPIRHIFYARH